MNSLKAAARRRANAPVDSWATLAPLSEEVEEAPLAVADAVSDEPPSEEVAAAVVDSAALVWESASAVALRVPHCSLSIHVD